MAYRDDLAALGFQHLYPFDGDYNDAIGSVNGTNTGTILTGAPLTEDATNCMVSNGVGDRVSLASTADINNSAQTRKIVCGWLMLTDIQGPPKSIYREGSTGNYFQLVVWAGNNFLFEVSNTSAENVQAFGDTVLVPNRVYHLIMEFEGSGFGDIVAVWLDGVKQSTTEPLGGAFGAASLNSRGVAEFGDASGSTEVGQAAVLLNAPVDGHYQHWAIGQNISVSDNDKREIVFEKGALPGVTIPSGTQSVMQASLDALASSVRGNEPLNIRVEALAGSGGGGGNITTVKSVLEVANTGSEETISINTPSSVEDDVIFAFVLHTTAFTATNTFAAAGWNTIFFRAGSTGIESPLLIAWKAMGATPDTSVDLDIGASTYDNTALVAFAVVSGADTSNFIDASFTGPIDNSPGVADSPPITTVTDGAYVLSLALEIATGSWALGGSPSGYDTPAGGVTEQSTFVDIGLFLAGKVVPTAGVEDPGAWSNTHTSLFGGESYTFAFRPASGGGGGSGGDLTLTADNITHDPLASIHVQYMGTDTLTWINENGSNASIASTPNGGTVQFVEAVLVRFTALDKETRLPIEGANILVKNGGETVLTGLTNASGVVENPAYPFSGNVALTGWFRKGSSDPTYKQAPIANALTVDGLDVTILMDRD